VVTPFELSSKLERVNDRLTSARTAGASLTTFAVAAASLLGLDLLTGRTVVLAASFAAGGGAIAAAVALALRWQRDDIRDDVLLAGYRHIDPRGVSHRAAQLVAAPRRRQLAATLERFLEAATDDQPTAVPLHRRGLRELAPRIRTLSRILRTLEIAVDPAGMVLVRRLVTDGARSPLFRSSESSRDLERALDSIGDRLGAALGDLRPAFV
jgi:hypothetical protein